MVNYTTFDGVIWMSKDSIKVQYSTAIDEPDNTKAPLLALFMVAGR